MKLSEIRKLYRFWLCGYKDGMISADWREYIRSELANLELIQLRERVGRLESIILAARNGEYDNAHEINAIRKFLFESMQEYSQWLGSF